MVAELHCCDRCWGRGECDFYSCPVSEGKCVCGECDAPVVAPRSQAAKDYYDNMC